MSEWQPIETAPRDGEHVLLARQGSDELMVGYFCVHEWRDAAGDDAMDEPTHWMPLPLPPKEEEPTQ